MSNELRSFYPLYSATGPGNTPAGALFPSVTVAATAASGNSTVFPGSEMSGRNQCVQIRVANTSAQWAYVSFGVLGAIAAATVAASYPVGPGAVEVISVDPEVNAAAVILASGTGNVTFTRGSGS